MMGQVSIVIAVGGPFEAVGRYLNRSSSARENLAFLLFGLVIVSIWGALYLWDRYRKHLPVVAVQKAPLFEQLCRTHSLNARQIADLREAARFHQLSEPAQLFVEPERLQIIGRDRPHDAARYNQLCTRLFGSLAADPAPKS